VKGDVLKLRFRGKSGVVQEVQLRDPKVARVVRRCQQLPGQELFNYVDAEGKVCALGSGDVNDYLADAAGERFTAKDFRTWHASVLALDLVRRSIEAGSTGASLRDILGEVAKVLGNTPAVCRKSYVHPGVLAMLGGKDGAAASPRSSVRGLKVGEVQLLGFLRQRRLARKAPARRGRRHAL
jgi:DNA topoisomerase I